jgi:glucose-6-phosphate 1-dehydrogenase
MIDITDQERPPQAPPCIFVIFGAGGDLAKRKLIPALYNLETQDLLPDQFAIVGVDRVEFGTEGFRDYLDGEVLEHLGSDMDRAVWDRLVARAYYTQGDFRDLGAYVRLGEFLDEVDREQHTAGSYLFYLATPPRFFGEIASQLGKSGLTLEDGGSWRRLIIEKPFGRDLESGRTLNGVLHGSLAEHQIYRIDHYLGKETVQNIMAYRFANSTVEPIWNHRYIDHVQITVAESLGVENRADYYETAGAMRDMVPNHLLALLGVIAMEPPNSFGANEVRDEQAKVLRAIQPLSPEDVLTKTVRGQYAAGAMPDGRTVPAYRAEPGIASDSRTETFVAMKLKIDSWRWAGVPFYLRTGKRMPGRYTEVVVEYKQAPNAMFRDAHTRKVAPNRLVVRIQPNEGIGMSFNAKVPGPSPMLGVVQMDFNYADYFGADPHTGYETLIYDCMNGDATLFKRADHIELGWQIVQPVLDVWQALPPRDFPNYPVGTWGPAAADELLAEDGHRWHGCAACA